MLATNGSPSELLEDAAETLDLLLDSQRAHRLPVRAGVDGEHGLALERELRAAMGEAKGTEWSGRRVREALRGGKQ